MKTGALRGDIPNPRSAGRDPLRMSGILGSELGYGPSVLGPDFLKAGWFALFFTHCRVFGKLGGICLIDQVMPTIELPLEWFRSGYEPY